MMQERWLCGTCDREWISNASAAGAQPWEPEHGCPGCHSSQIELIRYRPAFPGGDIPRTGVFEVITPPAPVHEQRQGPLRLV